MENDGKKYIAIDLKSFYASVECMERGLDPLNVNLVVADPSRTEKTICLAVSPSLKALGIPGRARLFEVIEKLKEENARRLAAAPGRLFSGSSYCASEIKSNPSLKIDFIIATPQMAKYMKTSTDIYNIYLRYVAPEDIHVYSIDEVFIDATSYLDTYKLTARELTMRMIHDVLNETGITATAGIGTNLYLCKIAMDIVAKKIPADKDGVRIAEIDEMSYRKELWSHRPLRDFWRVGRGYCDKLEANGLYTMGDIARCSLGKSNEYYNENLLYKLFGINAELLIDHAWGWEPCTIGEIKSYKPRSNSLSTGQVLKSPYSFEKARLIVREMADMLALDLVEKNLVSDQMVLTVDYDVTSDFSKFKGKMTTDSYGRKTAVSAHGSVNLGMQTSSSKEITDAVTGLYERILDRSLLVRKIYIGANHLVPESSIKSDVPKQLDFFTDIKADDNRKKNIEREKEMQKALIKIKKKYGKNAVLKGMNFEDGATAAERNGQVGGHKA